MATVLTSWQRAERRRGWLLLACGVPLALGGAVMVGRSTPLGQDWWTGLGCLVGFGACAALGAYKLRPAIAPPGDLDLSRTEHLPYSVVKLIGLTVLGAVMTAGAAVIMLNMPWSDPRVLVAGVVGAPFFGACTLVSLWRAIMGGGPAFEIGPDGIKVWRLGGIVVPWSKVTAVGEFISHGNRIIRVHVDDWKALLAPARGASSWVTTLDNRLGFDGLSIPTGDLDVPGHRVRALIAAHARARGIPVIMEPG